MTAHTYYTTLRPPTPGAVPRRPHRPIECVDFGERREVEPGILAWGTVTYDEPLTDEQVFNYDLAKAR